MPEDYSAPQDESYTTSVSSNGGCAKAAGIGCLIIALVALIAGIFVAIYLKDILAGTARWIATVAVEKSKLPQEQKQAIIEQIDRLIDDYKEGRITEDHLKHVLQQISESPLLPLGAVMYMEHQYVTPSGLTPAEKEKAKLTLQRLARGVFEEKIPEQAIQQIVLPLSEVDEDGDMDLKDTVTDEELRQFLQMAQDKVEEAGISQEPFVVNIADEIRKAIDNALQEPPPEEKK